MKKVSKAIKNYAKQFQNEYKQILAQIKAHDRIVVFRHIMPDYDALGTQMGLATFIKDNFPNKEVHVVGDNHVTFTPRIFPVMDSLNDSWFDKPFLAIIVDVGNTKRIADPRFQKADCIVKIDHHPRTENIATIDITETGAAAATEIVVNMICSFKGNYVLSKEAAHYFYIALVGDSGRFMYSSTTDHTFAVAQELLKTGINISDIYHTMYEKKLHDLQITAYILNHFHVSEHGVAYYVLNLKEQEELGITTERGKENVNLFSNIEGINCWCSLTEDNTEPCYRVSIRSKEKDISKVAVKWGGGGHAQASGSRLDDIKDLDAFIKDLDDLFIE